MAMPARTTGLTYEDLQAFPEDNLRREIIDGELLVTPAPRSRHQDVVLRLGAALLKHCEEADGKVYIAPFDVHLTKSNVVEPDVLFVVAERINMVEDRYVRGAPDIVVEVSSPSTKRRDLTLKHALYERFGVPEYWFFDLDADRIEVYRLEEGRYGHPRLLRRGDAIESELLPGFSVAADYVLGPAPEDPSDA